MSGTQVNMQRQSVIISGSVKYTVTTTCTVAGTLQDTSIFVLGILTPEDPKDDTFTRVIDIADVSTYLTNRDSAISQGDNLWRAATMTLTYDDIQTANAAWKELSNRINLLVTNYDTYLTEFETFTAGDVIIYPAVDASKVTELKNAYATAATAVTVAQTASDVHISECTALETTLDVTEERLQEAQADLIPLLSTQSAIAALNGSYGIVYTTLYTNNGQIRTENATSSAEDTEIASIEALLSSNDAVLTQFSTYNASLTLTLLGSIASSVSTIQGRVVQLTQEKNSLFTELNKCNTEQSKLQAAVSASITAREAALAAVIAVCPDFVP